MPTLGLCRILGTKRYLNFLLSHRGHEVGRDTLSEVVDASFWMLPWTGNCEDHVYHLCVPKRQAQGSECAHLFDIVEKKMVLLERFELSASPFPRECSTPEL